MAEERKIGQTTVEGKSSPVKASEKKNAIPSPFEKRLGTTLAERHPDWPHVKLKFYFSPHGTAEDIAGIKEHIPDADIYFYENVSGNDDTAIFQHAADIDRDKVPPDYLDKIIKDKRWEGKHRESTIRSLYGTRKIVGHIDLRPLDEIRDSDFLQLRENYINTSFDTTLENLRRKLKTTVRLQEQRERIMVERFEEELANILTTHPELQEKPELNVLQTMGSYHTSLFHMFNANGIEVQREFSQKPYIYGYHHQAQRDFAFGREPSREILAKAHMEEISLRMLKKALNGVIKDSNEGFVYVRRVASKFSILEIEQVHNLMIGSELTVNNFNSLLHDKGMDSLPRNGAELKADFAEQKEAEDKRLAEIKARFRHGRAVQRP